MKPTGKNQFSPTDIFSRVSLFILIIMVTVLCFSIVTPLPTGQFACAAEAVQDAAATARKLQLEGTRLQLQGNLEEAVKKYQESTSYHPNPKLDKLVKRLEIQIGQTEQAEEAPTEPAKQAILSQTSSEIESVVETPEQVLTQETTIVSPKTGTEVENVQETVLPGKEIVVEQVEQAVVIKRAPGTPEEELIYAFVDWMLGFFPDNSPTSGFGLETNRNYAITSAGGQYEVRLNPFIFYIDETGSFDFSSLVFNFQSQGKDKLAVQIRMPDKVLYMSDDNIIVAEMIIRSQNISGVWDRALQNFEQSDLKLGDITIQDIEKTGHLDIKELQLGNFFTRNGQGIWEEQYQGNLSGLTFVANEDNLTIQNITIQASQGGSNFSRYIELRNNILSIGDNLENMELADTKDIFSSLDEYIQIFNSSVSKIVIQGITVHVDGDMGMDSIEISGGLQKDVQTNKFVFNSNVEAKGFSFTEEGGQENMQPVSVSVDHVGFANNAKISQIPSNLFADLFTTIEGAEKVEEQEADAYLANHGMDFTKELLGLIKGYSSEINLKGLNVVNAMPNPVTLDVAKIGTSFNAGSGAGGRVNAQISFSGFNGMDQGVNNIPQSANLNLELKNIPSLLNLISDPSGLVEGDMDQVQGQVMMNGMNTFMTSALALSMTDCFLAFPASRFNLDFRANVDNTAKFLSTGNLKIAIENPDDFMRIAQSFAADPDMQRMLATITALANRTDENGKVVDSIDAQINQEGKIFINTKEVTNMFFPVAKGGDGENLEKEVRQEPAPVPNENSLQGQSAQPKAEMVTEKIEATIEWIVGPVANTIWKEGDKVIIDVKYGNIVEDNNKMTIYEAVYEFDENTKRFLKDMVGELMGGLSSPGINNNKVIISKEEDIVAYMMLTQSHQLELFKTANPRESGGKLRGKGGGTANKNAEMLQFNEVIVTPYNSSHVTNTNIVSDKVETTIVTQKVEASIEYIDGYIANNIWNMDDRVIFYVTFDNKNSKEKHGGLLNKDVKYVFDKKLKSLMSLTDGIKKDNLAYIFPESSVGFNKEGLVTVYTFRNNKIVLDVNTKDSLYSKDTGWVTEQLGGQTVAAGEWDRIQMKNIRITNPKETNEVKVIESSAAVPIAEPVTEKFEATIEYIVGKIASQIWKPGDKVTFLVKHDNNKNEPYSINKDVKFIWDKNTRELMGRTDGVTTGGKYLYGGTSISYNKQGIPEDYNFTNKKIRVHFNRYDLSTIKGEGYLEENLGDEILSQEEKDQVRFQINNITRE